MIKPDELVPLMILEWIKSDKQGEQEIVKDIETMGEFTWVNFHSGGRINGHVINEMMVLIGVAAESDIEKHLNQKNTNEPKIQTSPGLGAIKPQMPKPKNTFGFDILDKANRDSDMKLNISIQFPFISEEKIKMLLELYGEELFESLKDYVRQQLSEDVINECIEFYLTSNFKQTIDE